MAGPATRGGGAVPAVFCCALASESFLPCLEAKVQIETPADTMSASQALGYRARSMRSRNGLGESPSPHCRRVFPDVAEYDVRPV